MINSVFNVCIFKYFSIFSDTISAIFWSPIQLFQNLKFFRSKKKNLNEKNNMAFCFEITKKKNRIEQWKKIDDNHSMMMIMIMTLISFEMISFMAWFLVFLLFKKLIHNVYQQVLFTIFPPIFQFSFHSWIFFWFLVISLLSGAKFVSRYRFVQSM